MGHSHQLESQQYYLIEEGEGEGGKRKGEVTHIVYTISYSVSYIETDRERERQRESVCD